MRLLRTTVTGLVFILVSVQGAMADPTPKRPNGDDKTDLAPLGGASDSNQGPLSQANFPPFGAATNSAGPNPHETGPIDAEKAKAADHK